VQVQVQDGDTVGEEGMVGSVKGGGWNDREEDVAGSFGWVASDPWDGFEAIMVTERRSARQEKKILTHRDRWGSMAWKRVGSELGCFLNEARFMAGEVGMESDGLNRKTSPRYPLSRDRVSHDMLSIHPKLLSTEQTPVRVS
jgi:hypothetical protein